MAVDGITATYIAANQFSVTGNQTADFHAGRRCKAELTGGDVYSTISGSVFGAVTTVTLFDSELDNTLTKVWYGIGWGSEGSLPDHSHDSSEGSGAQFTSLVFLAPATIGVPDNIDLITLSSGVVTFDAPITIGNSDLGNVPGSIKWTGVDLEYNDGIAWQSLTGGGGGYVALDGSTPLTGDWDYGPFTISGTGDIAADRLGLGDVVDLDLQTSKFQVISEGVGWGSFYKYSDDSAGSAPTYNKARGTYASPAAVQAGDIVGGYNVFAHDGTQFDIIGKIRHLVESISVGNVKSYIEFHVTDTSGAEQEMARINSTGMILGDGVDQQADYPLHIKDASAYVSIEGTGTSSVSAILFEKQGNTQWSMYNDGANADTFLLESDSVNMYSIAIGRTYGDIGIGYKGPNLPNSSTRLSIIADESGGVALLNMYQHSEDDSGSAFSGYSSRGADQVNPTAVVADDVITGYNAFAHDGTVFDLVGRNRHKVESINLGDIASYWELHTSDISGTMREVVRVHSTGDLELYEGALILQNYGSIGVPGYIDVMTVSSGIVEFDGHIRATLSGTYDIGTSDYPFRDIYLTGGSVYLNAEKISSPSSGIIDFNNATIVNATISGGGGITDHSDLNELDYASAGHAGFVSIATTQTITGLKTFSQDVTMEADLTAVSGTFDYVEITDSISEIQFTSASGIIGVAGDTDLIQLEPEQVTIVGTANSRMIFQTVSGTIGVYNNEDMITFTAGGTLGSHSADLYFDNQTTVEFGYKAYFDHGVVVSGTIGIPGDESLLDLSNNQLTVGGLTAAIEFGTSSGTIGVSDNTDLMELTTTAVVFDGHIMTTTSGAHDIGESAYPFRDIYLTGGSVYLNDEKISSPSPGVIDFGGASIENATNLGNAGNLKFVRSYEVETGGVEDTFDITIPQTADILVVHAMVRSDKNDGEETAGLSFNNDSSSGNYNVVYSMQRPNSTLGSTAVDGHDKNYITFSHSASAYSGPSGYYTSVFMTIPFYRDTDKNKVATIETQYDWSDNDGTDTGIARIDAHGHWMSTAAITSLQLFINSGNLDAGSKIVVYGYSSDATDIEATYDKGRQELIIEHATTSGINILPGRIDIEDGSSRYALSVSGTLFKESLSLSASTWYYVYAKPPVSGNYLSESEIELSTTEPTRNTAKRGYYHGSNTDWRCFGAFYTNASNEIYSFSQIRSRWIFDDYFYTDVNGTTPSDTWTDVTFNIPFSSAFVSCRASTDYVDTLAPLRYRKKGTSGDGTGIGYVNTDLDRSSEVRDLPTDTDKKGQYRYHVATAGNLVYLQTVGFTLPDWIAPK